MYMHVCMWVLLGAILICVCWVAGAFVFVCWRLRALISHWYPQRNFV